MIYIVVIYKGGIILEQERQYRYASWASFISGLLILISFNINHRLLIVLRFFIFAYVFISFKKLLNKKYDFYSANRVIFFLIILQIFKVFFSFFSRTLLKFSFFNEFWIVVNFIFIFLALSKGVVFISIAIKLKHFFLENIYKLLNITLITLGVKNIIISFIRVYINLSILYQKNLFFNLSQEMTMKVLSIFNIPSLFLQIFLYIVLGIIFLKSSNCNLINKTKDT